MMNNIVRFITRFILVWLVSAVSLAFFWYISQKLFTDQFQRNWWLLGTYNFSEFLYINGFLFFVFCIFYYLILNIFLRKKNKEYTFIISIFIPLFAMVTFEYVTGIHVLFVIQDSFFLLLGFVLMILSGLALFAIDKFVNNKILPK